eukprot:863778-Rhodomonas_salina.1
MMAWLTLTGTLQTRPLYPLNPTSSMLDCKTTYLIYARLQNQRLATTCPVPRACFRIFRAADAVPVWFWSGLCVHRRAVSA